MNHMLLGKFYQGEKTTPRLLKVATNGSARWLVKFRLATELRALMSPAEPGKVSAPEW